MRKVVISVTVRTSLSELKLFLTHEYKMSRAAANSRLDRIYMFLATLGNPADYAPCRFRAWRESGYRCVAFEGWVFAYETFDDGMIVRDMAHGKALDDTASTI